MSPRLPLPRPRAATARTARALLALALAATGLTCRDRSLTGPSLPVQTALAIAPQFQATRGGPVIVLSRARVTLAAHPAGTPVVADETRSFTAGASSVAFDLTVPVVGESQRFILRVAGIDAAGDTVYRKVDTVTVRAGTEAPEPVPVLLEYAGPDTVVRFLDVAPRDTTITVGDSALMRAEGFDRNEAPVAQFAIGWTSGDSAVVRVHRQTGRVRAVRAGTAWIYGATLNGTIDSTQVTAFMPVARVAITPDSIGAVPGDTISLSAQAFGLDDQPVLGRTVTWAALDTNVVLVGTTGRVFARSPGRARIVAASEGRADTATVDVGQPVPTTIDVVGDSGTVTRTRSVALTAVVRDGHGAVIPNAPRTWTSRRPTVVSVDTSGVVTALVADSSAWIVAQSGAARDSIRIIVTRLGVASVGILPAPATVQAGATLQLTATPLDSAGRPNFDHPVTWASSDTMRARVSPAGLVTGRDSGTVVVSATSGGVTGSATVTVQLVRVASVVASPDTARTTVGDSVPVSVVARDSAGNVLTGRLATWRIADSTVATRLASGFVRGHRQATTQLFVTIDGLADTIVVVVAPPPLVVTHVAVEPESDTLASIGDTLSLVATAYFDANPVPATFAWVSRDTNVVRVDDAGRAVARANGEAWVVASASGQSDSALVVVRQVLASATVIPPTSIVNLGSQLVLTVDARDARNQLIAAPAVSYHSRRGGTVVSFDSTSLATARAWLTAREIGVDTIDVQYPGGGNGAVVASAIVTVRSGITSIVVTLSSDTARAAGQRITAVATARDSAGGTLPGITFQFALGDTSIARIDSTGADRVVLVSKSNGVTSLVASAQGVSSPPVQLVVSRAIAGVQVSPATASIDVGGTLPLVAQALDPAGQVIPDVAFAWTSDAPSIVAVDAQGVAHGVAPGSARVHATAGGVTSPQSVITVREMRILLAADTLPIGAPGSATIPVTIGGDMNDSVIVVLSLGAGTVPDTTTAATLSERFLHFDAGASRTQYVTITAVRPDTLRLIARQQPRLDSGERPLPVTYLPDTMVVHLRAGLRFSQSFELAVGDTVSASVALADPAPQGGVPVTFTYSQPGIARSTLDTVVVPQGLLTAPVRMVGLAAGTVTITPVAGTITGVPTTATVAEPRLAIVGGYMADSMLAIGAGQRERYWLQLPSPRSSALSVSISTGGPGAASVDTTIVVPAGETFRQFWLRGLVPGRDTVLATAAGWTDGRRPVVVTTPRVIGCCTGMQVVIGGSHTAYISVGDSLHVPHVAWSPVVVSLSSSDPSVLVPDSATVTVNSNDIYGDWTDVRGLAVGSAWLRMTAPGHVSDSVLVHVMPPKLDFAYDTVGIGAGQRTPYFPAVYLPASVPSPLTVTVQIADTSIASAPGTFTIEQHETYGTGGPLVGKRVGTTMIVASAPGFQPDTAWIAVSAPALDMDGSSTLVPGQTGYVYAYLADSGVSWYGEATGPLTLTFTSLDPVRVTVDPGTVVLAEGEGYAYATITGQSAGTARIVVSAPGYRPDTLEVTVTAPRLSFINFSRTLGLQQRSHYQSSVQRPYTPTNPMLAVTLTNLDPGIVSVPSQLTIPSGQTGASFTVTSLAYGTARIVATADGYDPDTMLVTVTRPRIIFDEDSLAGEIGRTEALVPWAADSLGVIAVPRVRVRVNAVSADTTIARVTPSFVYLDTASFGGAPFTATFVRGGSTTITFTDSAGLYLPMVLPVRVDLPKLHVLSRLTLGMRQRTLEGETQVCLGFAAEAALSVRLTTSNPAVATVTDSVRIEQGSSCAYYDVSGGTSMGSTALVVSAPGHLPDTTMVEVGRPELWLEAPSPMHPQSGRQQAFVYPMDHDGNIRTMLDTVRLDLVSSDPAVARFDSTAITLTPETSYAMFDIEPLSIGRTVVRAVDPRALPYALTAGVDTVDVVQPALTIDYERETIGIGQVARRDFVYIPYSATAPVRVAITSSNPAVARPAADTVEIETFDSWVRFDVHGLSEGTATITLSAPGFTPMVKTMTVTKGRTTVLWPDTVDLGGGRRVTLFITDSTGQGRPALTSTTFTLSSSNPNVGFSMDGNALTSVTVNAGNTTADFFVTGLNEGTADVTVANPTYEPSAPKTIVVRRIE